MKTLTLPSDPFLRGYLMAAFWTSDDNAPSGEYSTSGRPEEMMTNLSPEALERATADCAAFESANRELLESATEYGSNFNYDSENAGHDFWLSRNGHGAGYFDRDLGEIGDALQAAARASGSCDLYAGDDGKLYF